MMVKRREDGDNMPFANGRATMEVWLGCISFALKVDQGLPETMCAPETG